MKFIISGKNITAVSYTHLLDEILGLLDKHIATVDMVVGLLKQKDESMHLILTGNRVDPGILDYVDSVTTITTLGREQNS